MVSQAYRAAGYGGERRISKHACAVAADLFERPFNDWDPTATKLQLQEYVM